MSDSDRESDSSTQIVDTSKAKEREEFIETKIGKRLAYVLRYGAEKEGINISEEGFVELGELMKVKVFSHNTSQEVLKVVDKVTSSGQRRFERKSKDGLVYVRAMYGRRMERNPHHEGTKICRLMECCLKQIADNILDYDLQDFPDEYLLFTLMHRLKRQNKLNNKSLPSLLGATIERLDLGGMMITARTIRMVAERCPHLREVNLRETSYLLNDHILAGFLKKVPNLETLNLSGCIHQTDRTIDALIKHCPKISNVNLCHIPNITQEGVLKLLEARPDLKHLDIYDNKRISQEGREVLAEFCEQKDLVIILEGLEIDIDSKNNKALSLQLASVGKYW